MSRNALGRGLGALIREPEPAAPQPQQQPAQAVPLTEHPQIVEMSPLQAMTPREVDVDLIDPNPYQPRTHFREEALEELARSIQSSGIIQPLVLRKNGARFQLIAGERRWRAAQRAGLHRVPAILRDIPEEQALEITLVENLQREDLNAVEEARAYDRLISEFHMTQEEVAVRTGKERATIANSVRLLRLEKAVLDLLEEGRLTPGHGRALLGIDEPNLRHALAQRAARRGMTVRQLERFAARRARAAKKPAIVEQPMDANTRAALEELERHLGTRVTLRTKSRLRPGALVIEYYDDAQLAGIYDRLMH